MATGTDDVNVFPTYLANTGTGLTKRELFAALAMQGLMTVPMNPDDRGDRRWSEQRAELAVKHADALLAALAASRGEG